MTAVVRVLAVMAGGLLVVTTVASAVRATILPRGVWDRLNRSTTNVVRAVFRLRAKRATTYEHRDRVMAMLGPTSLLLVLTVWMTLLMAGYTAMYIGVTGVSVHRAVELSGSSVFTLGTTSSHSFAATLLSYSEAGLGLLILTLMITYLPSIYSSFSRRENGVSLLRVRAGDPPRATEMLIRFHRIEVEHFRLTELWQAWESWFTDVEETHATFPVLAFFRSPQPGQSWITASGALLDGAAFWVAAVEHPSDPDAQLCLRAGFQTLQRIASLFAIPFDADPSPDDPITITRAEWDAAMAEMEAAGVPLMADRDQAWRAWKGWRVNYDAPLLHLARLVEAPPAPWLSDRTPLPWGPTGRLNGRRPASRARRSRAG